MWLQSSPWPDTTALCSGDERGGKTVDQRGRVRYAQNRDKRDLLINMITTLPAFGPVGLPPDTVLGSAEVSRAAYGRKEAQNGKTAT